MNKEEYLERLKKIYLQKNISKESWSKINLEEIRNPQEGSLPWILIKILILEDDLCLLGKENNISLEMEKRLLFLERVCGVNY